MTSGANLERYGNRSLKIRCPTILQKSHGIRAGEKKVVGKRVEDSKNFRVILVGRQGRRGRNGVASHHSLGGRKTVLETSTTLRAQKTGLGSPQRHGNREIAQASHHRASNSSRSTEKEEGRASVQASSRNRVAKANSLRNRRNQTGGRRKLQISISTIGPGATSLLRQRRVATGSRLPVADESTLARFLVQGHVLWSRIVLYVRHMLSLDPGHPPLSPKEGAEIQALILRHGEVTLPEKGIPWGGCLLPVKKGGTVHRRHPSGPRLQKELLVGRHHRYQLGPLVGLQRIPICPVNEAGAEVPVGAIAAQSIDCPLPLQLMYRLPALRSLKRSRENPRRRKMGMINRIALMINVNDTQIQSRSWQKLHFPCTHRLLLKRFPMTVLLSHCWSSDHRKWFILHLRRLYSLSYLLG